MDGNAGWNGRGWRDEISLDTVGECKQSFGIEGVLDALKTRVVGAVVADLP